MAKRTSYTPGTFSWTDLTTTDQPAAKSFYTELFGWEAVDHDMGEGGTYSIAQIGGEDVAGIAPQPPQQRDAGVPPVWNSYATVESADQSLERAKEHGGTVHAPAFDVFDLGRMGVVADPTGAFLCLWEPRGTVGAGLVNAPGALSWNELHTNDLDAARPFYEGLFGWTSSPMEGSPEPYLVIQTADGGSNGGMTTALQPGVPPHWLVYFGTEDTAATLEKVVALGGQTLMAAMDIGMGVIGVAQDPQGAVFALFAGQFGE